MIRELAGRLVRILAGLSQDTCIFLTGIFLTGLNVSAALQSLEPVSFSFLQIAAAD